MAGKKRNKGGKNAFYFFMLDVKAKQKLKDMVKAAEVAGPIWEKMSPAQRRPYEEQAHSVKGEKYTSQGVSIKYIEQRENEKASKLENMKEDITKIITIADKTKNLPFQDFCLIHINYFCKDLNDKHYPAEVAISRFNLMNGVNLKDIYHSIIYPGQLPLGYSFEAKQYSERTHLLPVQLDGKNNTEKVFNEIIQFLQANDFPPLYALEENIPVVENVLKNFCVDYGEESLKFKIYSLEYMLFVLKNTVSSDGLAWPYQCVSNEEIEKDIFGFTTNISCEFHELSDSLIHCSKSFVTRYAYVICFNCCNDLNIPLIPGQHVPSSYEVTDQSIANLSLNASNIKKEISKPSDKKVDNFKSIIEDLPNDENKDLNFIEHEEDNAGSFEWQQQKRGNRKNKTVNINSQNSNMSSLPPTLSQSMSQTFFDNCSLTDMSQESFKNKHFPQLRGHNSGRRF